MSYNYFTNENPKEVINTSGNYGVVPASLDPTKIVDNLIEKGEGLGKLGASMPTPFARLYLFSAAFAQVNAENEKEGYEREGHLGIKDPNTGERVPSAYHNLVGECLDMLEFIFRYGDDKRFHVDTWSYVEECNKLIASSDSGHKELGHAMLNVYENTSLRVATSLYLFRWNLVSDKSVFIGGTSPISLVYTSANLCKQIPVGLFTGGNGNHLFTDNPLPLHLRSEKFRRFMYKYQLNDINAACQQVKALRHLARYIADSGDWYDEDLKDEVLQKPAYQNVKKLTSQGASISCAGVALYSSDHTINIDADTCDYLIDSTVEYYRQEWDNGQKVENVKRPMMLTKQGVDGLRYVNGRPWQPGKDEIPPTYSAVLSKRQLPGFNGTFYPFLTIDDFLEKKIIEVSYIIRREKFFTGCNKNLSFLLPLKKLFFKFFKLSDLFDENGNYTQMFSITEDHATEEVTVELRIPLLNGHSVTLHRRYGKDDKVDCYDKENTFDFAFFPFYRIIDRPESNVYNVMVGSTVKDFSTSFYIAANLGNAPKEQAVSVEIDKRTQSKGGIANTTHIHVPSAFDFMEVNIGGIQALVVPIFKEVEVDGTKATSYFSFSIDFGTTNTHVAYAKKGNDDERILKADIHSFEALADGNEDDRQVVTFHNDGGAADFSNFLTAFQREFVPVEIGDGKSVSFPMRTATCQVDTKLSALKMFANTNIGFNYNAELSKSKLYKTNIKWDRKDTLSAQRLREYFKEMLWLMKNKAVLNNGSDMFDLVVTYPQSMREKDVDNLKQAWSDAMQAVRCGVNLHYYFESVTPYYAYLSDLNYGEPYVNFDIGGGTTDILYINPLTREAMSFSAFFAANDLWNDGLNKNVEPKLNGFISYYRKTNEYKQMDSVKKLDIEAVLNNADSSADILSYLFTHDDVTRVSQAISNSPEMMQLLVIHFSSLMYYLAYFIDIAEVALPTRISFTGMGSKYINLISKRAENIAKLANSVLAYYGLKSGVPEMENAHMEVSFSDEPKVVTAKGGLIVKGHSNRIIPEACMYYGFKGEIGGKTLKYSDITQRKIDEAVHFFDDFVELLADDEFNAELSDLEYGITPEVVQKLRQYASGSAKQMADSSKEGQPPMGKVKDPMFFWPLKDSLYLLGKHIAANTDPQN